MTQTKRYACPYCGSEDTRSYRAIYEAGSASSTGRGSVDTGKLLSGGVDIQLTTVTEEARLAAKPRKTVNFRMDAGLFLAIAGPPIAFITFFIAAVGRDGYQQPLFTAIGFVIVVGAALFIWGRSDAKKEDRDLPERVEAWEKTWRCRRCARSFLTK